MKLDKSIEDISLFKKHMLNKGYEELSDRFLVKDFAESQDKSNIYHINITIDKETITAITGYNKDNEIVDLPISIVTKVQEDIDDALS